MGTIQTRDKQELIKEIKELRTELSETLKSLESETREVSDTLATTKLMNGVIATSVCAILILGSMGYRSMSDLADRVIGQLPFIDSREERQDDFKPDNTPLKNGDTVAGYRVSSQYLDPSRDNHRGVDIAAPSGTEYYAPGQISVRCFRDSGGGGNVAEFEYINLRWQLLHLLDNSCKSGQKKTGEIIGLMGSTGRSTGPHLHLQLRDTSGQFVEPKRGHVLAVMTDVSKLDTPDKNDRSAPSKIDAIASATSTRYGIPKSLIIAIAKHETGNYKSVIGSANAWGLKCVGNHPSCVQTQTTEYNNGMKGSYRLSFESCESISRCSQILGNTLVNLNTSKQWSDVNLALDSIGKRYATDPRWSSKVRQYL